MNDALPEISARLFDESSQLCASAGRNFTSFWQYSSAWRTAADLIWMAPLASTSSAPKEAKSEPAVSTLSAVVPRPMPNGLPALKQASAAFSMASLVHAFASAVSGTSAAGYIFTRSSPANSFIMADAPGRALVLRAPARRHRDPLALFLAQVVGHRIGFAVLGDQPADHVIDILELVGVVPDVPVADRDDIVPPACLRLGVDGQQVLLALRGDEVRLHLDLVLLRPGGDLLLHLDIAGRHPMVPEEHRDLSGGMGAADERRSHHGGRRRCSPGYETTTIDVPGSHEIPSCTPS